MGADTYADASLVLIPSGYSTGVVYGQRPLDSDSQITFTRASDATRVINGGLIEKVRTNLFPYSSEFTNAAWIKASSTITAEPSELDPNGQTGTVYRFIATAGNVYQNTQAINVQYTVSFYVKSGGAGNDTFRLRLGNFEPSAFTATSSWVRYTFTNVPTTAVFGIRTDGAGTTNVLIAFSQLETGDIATDYIATGASAVSVGPVSNVPRIDYTGGGCGKLLLEPQRTNLVTFSEQFDNAAWVKTAVNVLPNTSVSPDGYLNADKIISNSTNTFHDIRSAANISIPAGNNTITLFAKSSGYDFIELGVSSNSAFAKYATIVVNLFDGTNSNTGVNLTWTIVSSKIEDYGNGWYRISLTFNVDTLTGSGMVFMTSLPTSTRGVSFAGDGTSGALFYGVQLEAGSYATSYIPTLASSVTRVADAASKTGITNLIGQTEGTLFIELSALNLDSSTWRTVGISDGTTANTINFYFTGRGISNEVRALVRASSTNTFDVFYTGATITNTIKVAIAYASNDAALYVNGVQVATDSSVTVPACSQFQFAEGVSTSPMFGNINQTLLFKKRLSNDELAALTTL
jgi:hypothetical protein